LTFKIFDCYRFKLSV